eukprot:CAMPEP_0172718822 /NCGR_PEP_ID=MMETSP1074-20121228/75145_1 /TAXON_ID=2916 /ORGANISM="Ceratium fusus, Strain PA161109" /LENGTH=195 /DNA_ID=CAMNT_0013544097 /DNA_START=264 /DNA_END=852 /DNA_ORIENTATION=-
MRCGGGRCRSQTDAGKAGPARGGADAGDGAAVYLDGPLDGGLKPPLGAACPDAPTDGDLTPPVGAVCLAAPADGDLNPPVGGGQGAAWGDAADCSLLCLRLQSRSTLMRSSRSAQPDVFKLGVGTPAEARGNSLKHSRRWLRTAVGPQEVYAAKMGLRVAAAVPQLAPVARLGPLVVSSKERTPYLVSCHHLRGA